MRVVFLLNQYIGKYERTRAMILINTRALKYQHYRACDNIKI